MFLPYRAQNAGSLRAADEQVKTPLRSTKVGAGFFWPVWAMLGWGIGLAFNAWSVYGQRPITEQDIRTEMQRDS